MDTVKLSNEFRKGAIYLLRHFARLPDEQIGAILDDVIQVAWCRYLDKPTNDFFRVGKLAAQEFVRKNGAFYRSTKVLTEIDLAPVKVSRSPLPTEISAALMNEFFAQRRPSGPKHNAENRSGGQRRMAAAARDTLIVDLIFQGYSDEGIALELGTTYYSVRTWRGQIKRRLRHMLANQQQPSQAEYCPAWQ